MRTARVVGLSQDGSALIVAADSGEELAVPADERLRAALRGDRPRLGQLEIEMDSVLSPREIQARIRTGQSLAEVARVAGMPEDRVERFAAPVLAEREHVALQAQAASVRRRGETSAHRNLRSTLTDRLLGRGVDLDTLSWDSHRREDGRWAVTADYRSGEAERQAVFYFDVQGRFSVAGNDEARWVLGEQSSAKGPQPGRRRPDEPSEEDTDWAEPTLDLDDELALVRAISDPPPGRPQTQQEPERLATVQPIRPLPAALHEDEVPLEDEESLEDEVLLENEKTEPELPEPGWPQSEMDTLDELLDSDGYSEDSSQVYAGLSESPAVPETAVERGAGWEPAIVVDYPVEPSPLETRPAQTNPAQTNPAQTNPVGTSAAEPNVVDPDAVEGGAGHADAEGTDEPGVPDLPTGLADREAEADALADEQAHPEPSEAAEAPETSDAPDSTDPPDSTDTAPARAPRRKRASVPSWDEIMFGSPRNPS